MKRTFTLIALAILLAAGAFIAVSCGDETSQPQPGSPSGSAGPNTFWNPFRNPARVPSGVNTNEGGAGGDPSVSDEDDTSDFGSGESGEEDGQGTGEVSGWDPCGDEECPPLQDDSPDPEEDRYSVNPRKK